MHIPQELPIIRLVDKILREAVNERASDIHLESYETTFRVRYRIDGLLHEISALPLLIAPKIIARLKILANLNIAEKRLPQDGRFKFSGEGFHEIECRVSVCPTLFGEKIVLRLHQSSGYVFDMAQLGMSLEQMRLFLKVIQQPQGLIIITGPTGSGKSLTLYHALHHRNTTEVNICSIEDPVEIYLPGVNQVNINPKAGLTFATILRSFLRQDPDIIMIGEIRDLETAEIAISAAQTGHLVFTTVHSNSAADTLTRLKNLGVESYALASALTLVVAQRLVRKQCQSCVKPSVKCKSCFNGYSGRTGIFELLPISYKIAQYITQGVSASQLTNYAKSEGFKTLYESGKEKVNQQITTLEELTRMAIMS